MGFSEEKDDKNHHKKVFRKSKELTLISWGKKNN